MGFIQWARRLVGRSARPAALVVPKVMHMLGPNYHGRCGAAWSPTDHLTVELERVDCERCRWFAQRERIGRRVTRR